MNKALFLVLFAVLFTVTVSVLVGSQNVFADTTNDVNDIPSPSHIIDFSQFTGDFSDGCPGFFSDYFCFTTGPIQVGDLVLEDITWSSKDFESVIGNGIYGLGGNGIWDSERNGYVGSDSNSITTTVMRFDFNDDKICAVGGFVNYATGLDFPVLMKAIGSGNVVLEIFDVSNNSPINTPSAVNDGEFRGFVRASNDIAALELSGEFDVLDDLKFARCDKEVNLVGGKLMLIDTTAVLLAGAHSTTWLIPVVLSVLGIGLMVRRKI